MEIQILKVADLHIAEKNVRRHPQKQLDEIKRSFEMFGQYRPLVVASDGECLVGNGFLEAMMQMGKETVECIVLPPDTTDIQKRKLMLADNKIFDLGGDAMGNIDELLSSMEDFDIPGFDETVLSELYSEVEAQVSAVSVSGVVPEERREQIERVAERRAQNPPVDDPQKYEVKQAVVEMQEKAEPDRPYITCPHCGTKIWL